MKEIHPDVNFLESNKSILKSLDCGLTEICATLMMIRNSVENIDKRLSIVESELGIGD